MEDESGPWRMDPGTDLSQSEFVLMRHIIAGTPLDGALVEMGVRFESGGHLSREMLGKVILLTRFHVERTHETQQELLNKYSAFLDSLLLHLSADELLKKHDWKPNKEAGEDAQ